MCISMGSCHTISTRTCTLIVCYTYQAPPYTLVCRVIVFSTLGIHYITFVHVLPIQVGKLFYSLWNGKIPSYLLVLTEL
jgi:hypothetical protein